jgi:exopolyphosphatase / guanosine-5'-triphosphate,3'-diphosphate pyrophosphatase
VSTPLKAAIDCGTNSTRLLITGVGGATLVREMRITRLGQGVDATGTISSEALERTFGVLGEYRAICDTHGVTRGRLAATSAARDASNGAAFLAEASAITGFTAEIISGIEEGELSFRGAMADLEPSGGDDLVLDIGGGSTELVMVRNGELTAYSMQAGCVRITERALHGDPPTPGELDEARRVIAAQLDLLVAAMPDVAALAPNSRLVGLAGTVATLAMMDLGLVAYDHDAVHHHWLSREHVAHWAQRLAALTVAQRRELPGMVPGREDVLLGGVLVLESVLDRLGLNGCLSSESDILDGLAASVPDQDLPSV